jgi:hypothetical protein
MTLTRAILDFFLELQLISFLLCVIYKQGSWTGKKGGTLCEYQGLERL